MIRVAIADDEKNICDTIRKYIGEYVTTSDMDFEVKCFTSCEELMNAVMREDMYDLIFLDIEFSKDGGEMNGIEFGKRLRSIWRNDNAAIVYVTSYKEYAIDAIKIRPYDYIEKPVRYERMKGLLDSYVADYKFGKNVFEFLSNKIINRVAISNIRYFESDGRRLVIHTLNNDYNFYGKMADIVRDPRFRDFVWIHKSYLVNINFVEKFTSASVIMIGVNSEQLPVSRANRMEITEKLMRRK